MQTHFIVKYTHGWTEADLNYNTPKKNQLAEKVFKLYIVLEKSWAENACGCTWSLFFFSLFKNVYNLCDVQVYRKKSQMQDANECPIQIPVEYVTCLNREKKTPLVYILFFLAIQNKSHVYLFLA